MYQGSVLDAEFLVLKVQVLGGGVIGVGFRGRGFSHFFGGLGLLELLLLGDLGLLSLESGHEFGKRNGDAIDLNVDLFEREFRGRGFLIVLF